MNKRSASGTLGPMIIIGVLFFVFGFVTWINSFLIPYFKLICSLTVQQSMLVAFAFYISYFIMAFPSSYILKKTGYKNGMMAGLLVMAVGAFVFIPAAMTREYSVFLLGLFIEATGLTLLQTASNPYVTILGPIESAASRISIMGVCNKVAGAIAPLILAGAITRNPNEIDEIAQQLTVVSADQQNLILDELSQRLIVPYIITALILIGLGVVIRFTSLPDIKDEDTDKGDLPHHEREGLTLFSHRHLVAGAITIFCAVAVEALAVDSIINYAQYEGLTFRDAKYFATYTLLFMVTGYIIGIFAIPKFLSQKTALLASAVLGVILVLLTVFTKGSMSIWFVALMGLANAQLWPTIWPLSLKGLGRLTSKGSALLIMGILGGAVVPLIYGAISDATNLQVAYLVMIPFYLFIIYFAMYGHKLKNSRTGKK